MANDSNAIRVPDDLLQRLEADAIARLVSPFTKPSRALLVRAVLEQGLRVLEGQLAQPAPKLLVETVDPAEEQRVFRATAETFGAKYARDEFNANARHAGDGATEWFHKHESQLVRDMKLPARDVDAMHYDAAVIYARTAFREALERMTAAVDRITSKPREKRAPRKSKRSR